MSDEHLGYNTQKGLLKRLPEGTLVVECQKRQNETAGSISSPMQLHKVQVSSNKKARHLKMALVVDFKLDQN